MSLLLKKKELIWKRLWNNIKSMRYQKLQKRRSINIICRVNCQELEQSYRKR